AFPCCTLLLFHTLAALFAFRVIQTCVAFVCFCCCVYDATKSRSLAAHECSRTKEERNVSERDVRQFMKFWALLRGSWVVVWFLYAYRQSLFNQYQVGTHWINFFANVSNAAEIALSYNLYQNPSVRRRPRAYAALIFVMLIACAQW